MSFDDISLNDGRKIPSLAFGTGSAWYGKDAAQYVASAIYAGFSHIDTAQAYNNEWSVGAALKDTGVARSEVWVTTKYYGIGGRQIRYALQQSLVKLGLKHVDLYLIHNPRPIRDLAGTWKEFEEVLHDGLTKSIGVSNFTVKDLELLKRHAKITPAVNQISFNPYKLRESLPILEYCKEHGIVVESYGSLAPITKQPNGPVDGPVHKAAKRLHATPGQVLLAWVRQKGAVVVTTTSRKDRLDEYLHTGDLPPLTEDEIKAIDLAGLAGGPSALTLAIRGVGASIRDAVPLPRVPSNMRTILLVLMVFMVMAMNVTFWVVLNQESS